MKAFPWILVAILTAVVAWNYTHPTPPIVIPSTVQVRDSANNSADSQRAHIDTLVRWVRVASADTLAAIMRDRARRPAVLGRDTVYLPAPVDTTTDSACFSQAELASLEAQHAVDSATIDSLRWDSKIWKARGDSLEARLGPALATKFWKSTPIAFGLGYAAGITTCLVLK